MKKVKTKLSGFTILEVVIVMLLVSVVVAMSYTVFQMVKTYELKITHQNQVQSKFLLANTAFTKDIEKASYLIMGSDSALICSSDSDEGSVIYQVLDSLFIRIKNDENDTLLTAPAMKLSYTFIGNKNHPKLIKTVVLTVTDTLGRNIYISGNKEYSSTTLFKAIPDATN